VKRAYHDGQLPLLTGAPSLAQHLKADMQQRVTKPLFRPMLYSVGRMQAIVANIVWFLLDMEYFRYLGRFLVTYRPHH
jgi:hypothetical protein